MATEIIQTNTDFLPINLIDKAITKGTDIASLEKLMDLQERWEKSQAQKAFNHALAQFQQQCPTLIKKKDGHNCKYTPLGDIIAQIKDVLFNNGLKIGRAHV